MDKKKLIPGRKCQQKRKTVIGGIEREAERWKMSVYVLVGYNTTFEQDLERVYTLIELGY